MIPYFQILKFNLGLFSLQSWGTMVALGFIIAMFVAGWRMKKLGLNHKLVWDFGLIGILGAIVGSRLFHCFFYTWDYYQKNLLEILYFWTPGYSLYGGIAGLSLGVILYIKIKKLDFWKYADVIAFSAPAGLAVGRIGCFFIHDHPGIQTNFFLGVQYPGGARWDLGPMQLIANLIIFTVFIILMRKERAPGFYVCAYFIYYGATRFFLDFLRAWEGPIAETRYFELLTPAQIFSVILIAVGVMISVNLLKKRHGAL